MPVPGEQQHPPTDAELIAMVRAGDRRAYGPLYERHRRAALRVARHLARDEAAADDLAAEAFTRVLAAIDRGNGPDEAFRAYLYTTLRRTAFDWAESEKRLRLVENIAELEVTAAPVTGADRDPLDEAFDRQITSRAFHSLPERWQIVLWHLEVEGESPVEVAPLLNLSPSAVSALAYRAREGLRQAFLQEHLAETVNDRCRPFAQRLAAFVRGKLGTRDTAKVERHLDTCADCTGLYLELLKFNESLPEVLSPLVFGSAAAAKIIAGVAVGAAAGAGLMATSAGTTATVVGGGTAAGAAADGTAKAGALLARWLMQLRKARTQAITMAAVAVVACAILAWGMSGGTGAPPLETPPSSAPAVALPAPTRVASTKPTPKPAPPAPKPTNPPVVKPTPVRYSSIVKPPAPRPRPTPPKPKPTPAPTPTPVPSPTQPARTPTTPPPPPPSSSPTPTPPAPTHSTEEPTICELAWQAIKDPTPENIGLILAARWDPFCVPVPWVPWLQWPPAHGTHQVGQHGAHTERSEKVHYADW
ncbi:RNA polymerase, sigma-24 subunit, ECF subfamily [Catenulispora acidiphila DSM 44928]|uniref:RNA polymerase, sigma-24 subunit, ECF subfamily n=1 Tax=Catenulispora acidiphila (strain DSM 44928 / JCM 14897 / NBRC 102108 / NRRL B-24433 / ID139908) TaxID=479433 RepID=C7QIA9_CATAD|nr:sigma-70 family RNA polymerase sigma factor [Catenulispora acidiphila]ACU74986.1 RNA polymerase, sigma-24 subunit, ECF subfamily [Catenulispora acidiphila DSM 44928]